MSDLDLCCLLEEILIEAFPHDGVRYEDLREYLTCLGFDPANLPLYRCLNVLKLTRFVYESATYERAGYHNIESYTVRLHGRQWPGSGSRDDRRRDLSYFLSNEYKRDDQ